MGRFLPFVGTCQFRFKQFSHALLGHVYLRAVDIEGFTDFLYAPLVNAVTFVDLELLGAHCLLEAFKGCLDNIFLPFFIVTTTLAPKDLFLGFGS